MYGNVGTGEMSRGEGPRNAGPPFQRNVSYRNGKTKAVPLKQRVNLDGEKKTVLGLGEKNTVTRFVGTKK